MSSSFSSQERANARDEARVAETLREFWQSSSNVDSDAIWSNIESAIQRPESRWRFLKPTSLKDLLSPRQLRYAPAALVVAVAIIAGSILYSRNLDNFPNTSVNASLSQPFSADSGIERSEIPGYTDAIVQYRESQVSAVSPDSGLLAITDSLVDPDLVGVTIASEGNGSQGDFPQAESLLSKELVASVGFVDSTMSNITVSSKGSTGTSPGSPEGFSASNGVDDNSLAALNGGSQSPQQLGSTEGSGSILGLGNSGSNGGTGVAPFNDSENTTDADQSKKDEPSVQETAVEDVDATDVEPPEDAADTEPEGDSADTSHTPVETENLDAPGRGEIGSEIEGNGDEPDSTEDAEPIDDEESNDSAEASKPNNNNGSKEANGNSNKQNGKSDSAEPAGESADSGDTEDEIAEEAHEEKPGTSGDAPIIEEEDTGTDGSSAESTGDEPAEPKEPVEPTDVTVDDVNTPGSSNNGRGNGAEKGNKNVGESTSDQIKPSEITDDEVNEDAEDSNSQPAEETSDDDAPDASDVKPGDPEDVASYDGTDDGPRRSENGNKNKGKNKSDSDQSHEEEIEELKENGKSKSISNADQGVRS